MLWVRHPRRLLGASPPPARPLRGPLGTLRVPPARHPPGLRPRPSASPLNRPPKGAVYVPQQGGGLPPPLSGASRLPVRPPRKGLRPSPPLRGGSPPQQPAIKNESATFVPRRDCLCLRGGASLTTVPRLMETAPAATPQGQMCIGCRAFDQATGQGGFSARPSRQAGTRRRRPHFVQLTPMCIGCRACSRIAESGCA